MDVARMCDRQHAAARESFGKLQQPAPFWNAGAHSSDELNGQRRAIRRAPRAHRDHAAERVGSMRHRSRPTGDNDSVDEGRIEE